MLNGNFIKGISIDWDKIDSNSYLRRIPSLNGVRQLELSAPVTFFVGENGTGKSTLLEAIAIAYGFNPEGGTKNYRFSTYDTHSELFDAIKLVKSYRKERWGYFLRAESFYNVATKAEEYGHDSYHQKSHGESFLAVTQDNLSENGLYLFDEPEAALSPERQLTLLADVYDAAKNGSQFIIATHSPILLGMPSAEILSFDDGAVHKIRYEETGSYKITEMFINNRKSLLHKLLGADE